jgi:lysophospholipase L1-like esterase
LTHRRCVRGGIWLTAFPAESAEEVIAGLRATVKRLRAAGIRPRDPDDVEGDHVRYPRSPEAIARRNQINDWIRHSGVPFVDFHAATRDPSDPDRLGPAFDSGDQLHPNDTGYRAMASAVKLRLLLGPSCARE